MGEQRASFRHFARACLAGSLLLFACEPAEQHEEQHEEENNGTLCFYTLQFELVAHVVRDGCLSASCDTERQGECTLAVEGSDVSVQSRFSFTSRGGECLADCGTIIARCTAPPPPEGPFTAHFGPRTAEVVRDSEGTGNFDGPPPAQPGPAGRDPCHIPPHLR